ncbi:MAG TPA: hypothetical protein VFL41_05715 [Gaiellaceae bacterium]|nr:hypothetical protein [Gaiellaceae bacterium]
MGEPSDPNNEPGTWELHLEVPNVSEAPNGDRISVTGSGVFSVHPKSVTASGTFTHTDADGSVVGSGAWTADKLLSFELYGCGIGVTLPPDFCGGALKLDVTLTPTGTNLALDGKLTIFCIVGPQAPSSHDDPSEEGIRLVLPGVANFNQIVSGMNIYIQTS